jgi:hypothetical protein
MLLNIIAFQIGWFACVLGGAHGWPWLGVVVTAAAVALHLYRAPRPRMEAMLIGVSGLLGFIADSLLTGIGLLRFPSGQLHAQLAPYWMVAMWMLFATTLNISLGWLKPRLGLAALLGMIAGPLAYYGGAKLGGVSFVNPLSSLVAVAGVWTWPCRCSCSSPVAGTGRQKQLRPVPDLARPIKQVSQGDHVAEQEQREDPSRRPPGAGFHQGQPDRDEQQPDAEIQQRNYTPGIGDEVAQTCQHVAVAAGDQDGGHEQAEQDSADNDDGA